MKEQKKRSSSLKYIKKDIKKRGNTRSSSLKEFKKENPDNKKSVILKDINVENKEKDKKERNKLKEKKEEKRIPLTTIYCSWKEKLVEHKTNNGIIRGIPSVAATQTTFIWKSICFDAGWIPHDVSLRVLLLTHMHSDHSRDLMNVVNGNNNIIIFCPASVSANLFKMIHLNISMQKGRMYSYKEISKMVTIYGCKKSLSETTEPIHNMSVTYVIMGEKIRINLKGQEDVYIEPFPCYHSVDTVGYMVYDIRKCMINNIDIPKNKEYIINMTEDQKYNKEEHKDKFIDVKNFSEKYGVVLNISIKPITLKNEHILHQRILTFPEGMKLSTIDNDNKCILSKKDFGFLKKYGINIRNENIIPHIMFFGDTTSQVFKNTRVKELMSIVETVIIESTFLESPQEMDDKKFKERKKKRHMFLHELVPVMKANEKTQFLLCHFSACYDKQTIIKYIVLTDCNNAKAFI